MNPIRFEAVQAEHLNVFHYLPGEDLAVTRHWPGLFQAWPEGKTPFTEYAVNNNNMEEVAVYVGLVWRLTAGLARYAIPTYYRDDAERFLERAPVLVDWEYEVDAEELTAASRDKGFVPARAAVTFHREPTSREVGNAHQAGLFPLATPRDLVAALHAVIFDASSEISIFAVEPAPVRFERLAGALRGLPQPDLAGVLGDEGIFVDLTIGSDVGNFDSITVASRVDLRPRIDELTSDYVRRIETYEAGVEELPDVEAFLQAMHALVGVSPNAL